MRYDAGHAAALALLLAVPLTIPWRRSQLAAGVAIATGLAVASLAAFGAEGLPIGSVFEPGARASALVSDVSTATSPHAAIARRQPQPPAARSRAAGDRRRARQPLRRDASRSRSSAICRLPAMALVPGRGDAVIRGVHDQARQPRRRRLRGRSPRPRPGAAPERGDRRRETRPGSRRPRCSRCSATSGRSDAAASGRRWPASPIAVGGRACSAPSTATAATSSTSRRRRPGTCSSPRSTDCRSTTANGSRRCSRARAERNLVLNNAATFRVVPDTLADGLILDVPRFADYAPPFNLNLAVSTIEAEIDQAPVAVQRHVRSAYRSGEPDRPTARSGSRSAAPQRGGSRCRRADPTVAGADLCTAPATSSRQRRGGRHYAVELLLQRARR